MAPLLVRLYDNQRLYGLAADKAPAARAELTGVVAELLEKDLGPRERELVSDVLISLLRQAEVDLRAALAERLALMDHAPLRVILHMANDVIEVARPVLTSSVVLSDLDLLYIIKGKSPEYWRAIATRVHLSEGVMNALAETREPGTALVLAENTHIQLTLKTADILGTMAEGDETLAKPLLMRDDLPEDIARHLYKYVGEALRRHIAEVYGVQDSATVATIDDVVVEFSDGGKSRNFLPTAPMMAAAEKLARSGKLNLPAIMDPLQRGQFGTFIAMFSRFSGMDVERLHEMLCDGSGKKLAMVCRALGLSKGELSRIYMMTQRLRSEDRIVDHNELLRALSVYDNLTVEKARAVLGIKGQ